MSTILVLGAFDTKGAEHAFLRECLLEAGVEVLSVNLGVMGTTDRFPVDIEADEIARHGGESVYALREAGDRGEAVRLMGEGAASVVRELFDEGRFDAIVGMGGSGGTSMIAAAMRSLPVGVPKLCVSTVAAGDIAPYVGTKDIVMMPSVVDVAGVNRVSRVLIRQAAAAIVGMAGQSDARQPESENPVVAATMFGNTTECVDACRRYLEESDFEVLVFHATGVGGRAMEELIDEGWVDAVLDVTTTEWADEIAGGIMSAGPTRLEAAGRRGLPQLIVPGCLDMVNFGPIETVPEHLRRGDRHFYEWAPAVTLMRTTAEENRRLGTIFAEKANGAQGPIAFLVPTCGFSVLGEEGDLFHDPEADGAFSEGLRETLDPSIRVETIDVPINDAAFSKRAVAMLLELIEQGRASG
ncbi:hypothetical protein Pan216_01470 [Planctomycetes bacterium Pan216]|uniref:Uncharacterized protein n=1 Tax=Kolteria novifilia TaxID=2527975 RepID=A0A518AX57_9BACT|nr:hypothetical protein Pan216_01470 [Planctomycetes bacterium Pan216]